MQGRGHGRRVFVVGIGAALIAAPREAQAWPKRPGLWVTVHANHPLRASLGDELDAPAKAVIGALRDVSDWASWVPMFTRSDLVSKHSSGVVTFDGELDLPWPVRDRSFRAEALAQGALGLSLDRVAGYGNMGNFDAALTVTDLGNGRSEIRADVEIDFGLRLTKGFIEWLVRIKAPQLFEALEVRARS